MLYQNFYAELGKLLYAIVKSNGSISEKEKQALHKAVVEKLIPNESHVDEFGVDTAYYTEMEFDVLESQNISPEDAFTSFINYIDDHHTAFDERLIRLTLDVSSYLASSYYGINKKEQLLLNRLQEKIKVLAVNP